MKKSGKKGTPDVNASSTADIAFLLLIFFLVSTTMNSDTGLSRMLPPLVEQEQNSNDAIVKERNVFPVKINYRNELLVRGEWSTVDKLKEQAKEFIANPHNDEKMPEKTEVDVPYFGKVMVTKGVISLQNDRGSKYEAYLQVQNELQAAYNELRDELAKQKFKKNFDDLEEDQKDAIKKIYPQKISEAEPHKK